MGTSKMNTIRLNVPLKNAAGDPITEVEVMKPNVGALRGLQLAMVQMQDTNALLKLLPRITRPALLPDQLEQIDPADWAALANRVSLFFMTAEQLQMVQIDHQG